MGIDLRISGEGFTGLEAALVLLAFIVVASVFSYVVLGAGFFTIQKSQEVIHSAVDSSSSPVILETPVYGIKNESSGNIGSLMITIGKKYGSDSVLDISGLTITWSDKEDVIIVPKSDPLYSNMPVAGTWGIIDKQGDQDYPLDLECGEYATLLINLSPEREISKGNYFRFELMPPGSSVSFGGVAPIKIDDVTTLYLNN